MKVTIMYLNEFILQLLSNIQKFWQKGSGWIIDSVLDHNISISKYNPLAGGSYIKLQKELDHPRKGLSPPDPNPRKITKADKESAKKLNFKGVRIPFPLVFLVINMRKNIQFMYQKYVVKENILIYYQ